MVVMDSFALPVEGTETRVNAQAQGYEYMTAYIESAKQVGTIFKLRWHAALRLVASRMPLVGITLTLVTDVGSRELMFPHRCSTKTSRSEECFSCPQHRKYKSNVSGPICGNCGGSYKDHICGESQPWSLQNLSQGVQASRRYLIRVSDNSLEQNWGLWSSLQAVLQVPIKTAHTLNYSTFAFSMDVTYFKSALDKSLLDSLWNHYWVNTKFWLNV